MYIGYTPTKQGTKKCTTIVSNLAPLSQNPFIALRKRRMQAMQVA